MVYDAKMKFKIANMVIHISLYPPSFESPLCKQSQRGMAGTGWAPLENTVLRDML